MLLLEGLTNLPKEGRTLPKAEELPSDLIWHLLLRRSYKRRTRDWSKGAKRPLFVKRKAKNELNWELSILVLNLATNNDGGTLRRAKAGELSSSKPPSATKAGGEPWSLKLWRTLEEATMKSSRGSSWPTMGVSYLSSSPILSNPTLEPPWSLSTA
eukprot:Gb_20418 [translate_table: standard]